MHGLISAESSELLSIYAINDSADLRILFFFLSLSNNLSFCRFRIHCLFFPPLFSSSLSVYSAIRLSGVNALSSIADSHFNGKHERMDVV